MCCATGFRSGVLRIQSLVGEGSMPQTPNKEQTSISIDTASGEASDDDWVAEEAWGGDSDEDWVE